MSKHAKLSKFLMYAAIVGSMSFAMGHANSAAPADDEGVASRILPIARVTMAKVAQVGGAPRSGEAIYNAVCMACHAAGAAGAPKTGDNAAWAPRLKLGLNGLVNSATAGKNLMPPKGSSDASQLELTRAIVFMTNKSGAKFVEPK